MKGYAIINIIFIIIRDYLWYAANGF